MSANDLHALSALVTYLRAEAMQPSLVSFRRRALARLSSHLPFDRAIWADARVVDRMVLRAPELFNIIPAEQHLFETAAYGDPRLPTVLAQSGTAFAYSVGPDDPAAYLAAVMTLGLEHFLSIAHFDPILGMASGIVLFNSLGRPAFTAENRVFIEAAFPHLRATWTECQVNALLQEAGVPVRPRVCNATTQGLLFTAAQDDFVAMLQLEWPDWIGPHLPPALIDPRAGTVKPTFYGKRIIVHTAKAIDTAVIAVRERSAIDDLTVRERAVAELCGQGFSYKEISASLNIAPSTARNHIAAVHKRLNVKRNSEIGRLLTQTATPWPPVGRAN